MGTATTSVDTADRALESSLAHLRLAVKTQRDGSHLGMLLALRQLRDSELEPLFAQLLQHGEWQVQVHAVLGLAEVQANGLIAADHLARVDPLAQEAAIASALDLGLLAPEQVADVLAIDGLHPMSRLLLQAERVALGLDVNQTELSALVDDREFRIAALASLLRAQAGSTEEIRSRISTLRREGAAGERKLLWLLDAARQYRLSANETWIRGLLEEQNVNRTVKDAAVFSALSLDPKGNIDVWHRGLGENAPLSRRVRYGLMLLSIDGDVPASAFDRIAGGDELTTLLASAGRALGSGSDASSALIELLDFGHVGSMEWVLSSAKELSHEVAQRVYLHVLDRLIEMDRSPDPRRRGPRAEWVSSGIIAAARLFEFNPVAAQQKLQETTPTGEARMAILLGMLESHDPAAGEVARSLDLSKFELAESLAILLIARHSEVLSADEMNRLRLIASGGGRLSADLRAQAAWLYIKQSGNAARALPQLLNEAKGANR